MANKRLLATVPMPVAAQELKTLKVMSKSRSNLLNQWCRQQRPQVKMFRLVP